MKGNTFRCPSCGDRFRIQENPYLGNGTTEMTTKPDTRTKAEKFLALLKSLQEFKPKVPFEYIVASRRRRK